MVHQSQHTLPVETASLTALS